MQSDRVRTQRPGLIGGGLESRYWGFQPMEKVIDVRALDDYRIWLRFDDGAQGEVDLSDLAGRGVVCGMV